MSRFVAKADEVIVVKKGEPLPPVAKLVNGKVVFPKGSVQSVDRSNRGG